MINHLRRTRTGRNSSSRRPSRHHCAQRSSGNSILKPSRRLSSISRITESRSRCFPSAIHTASIARARGIPSTSVNHKNASTAALPFTFRPRLRGAGKSARLPWSRRVMR
ncbi:hypothetical protein D2T33_12390 [Sinirhodobacter populi]|uniref:Uncharacterized protein n=1 Tax=Paenirhodobacter populi TaxID=2306993 RepID=A0A443ITD7_9RHOB|nr:hypothetical protein D2T33_12390 [Sinirhodobacter populi]